MSKIYIVEANFDGYECSWSHVIGAFNSHEIANQFKDKWELFYKEHKSIFDGLSSDSDDEEEINKYYQMSAKFDDINKFTHVSINEFDLNKDTYSNEVDFLRTEDMQRLVTEWERDYKLTEILKK